MDIDELNLAGDLMSGFSFPALMAAFIFGVIGIYLFRVGRKRVNTSWVWIGVALMVYPLFISGVWQTLAIGLGLCVFAYIRREDRLN